MKNALLLFTIILLCLTACRKEDNTTSASGRVLQFGTNTPIEGAIVYLQECSSEGLLTGTASCTTIDTVITGADGRYEFIDFPSAGSHWITAKADQYYDLEERISIIDFQNSNNNDIIFAPYAWLKLHIKNINPVDELDYIYFTSEHGASWQYLTGMEVDEILILEIKGNTDNYVLWDVNKNGEEDNYNDTVNVSAHDTLLYEIFF